MQEKLRAVARDIRCDALDSFARMGSAGHIGGSLSIVELLTVLYFEAMNIDPKEPDKPGRDRFVCSKGHAGPAVYAALANRGYFDRAWLATLNSDGGNLPSHCDMNRTPGVDMTTGSLGQGVSCAAGIALGSKIARDGATVYAVIGDGESQEGEVWECALFAAAKKLDNLVVFTDYNKLQIDGTVEEVCGVAPLADKWRAFGWNVIEVSDGNDVDAVSAAVKEAKANRGTGKPTMLILHTRKGCGVASIEAMGAPNHAFLLTREAADAAIREVRGC